MQTPTNAVTAPAKPSRNAKPGPQPAPTLTVDSPQMRLYRASIENKSEQELVSELAGHLVSAAERIARMAIVISVMEARGFDTSQYRTGIGQYMHAVATGRLLPEIVVRFIGNVAVLRACSSLQLSEQERLLRTGEIEVKRTAKEVVRVPLDKASPIDLTRAIDPIAGRVIPPSQQVVRSVYKPAQIDHRVTISLPYSEFQALTKAAGERGVTVATLVRNTLQSEGLLR